jgi:hypothetical protein
MTAPMIRWQPQTGRLQSEQFATAATELAHAGKVHKLLKNESDIPKRRGVVSLASC